MQILIKYDGHERGTVQTMAKLHGQTQDLTQLGGNDLAQLWVDVWLEDQPQLRPGEKNSLYRLIHWLGRKTYGEYFYRLAAARLLASAP